MLRPGRNYSADMAMTRRITERLGAVGQTGLVRGVWSSEHARVAWGCRAPQKDSAVAGPGCKVGTTAEGTGRQAESPWVHGATHEANVTPIKALKLF